MPKKKGGAKKYNVGDVILMKNPVTYDPRKRKWGVIVQTSPSPKRRILYINTEKKGFFDGPTIEHRYYPFLNGVDRFISCAIVHNYTFEERGHNVVIGKVDRLRSEDMRKLRNYITAVADLPKDYVETIAENITTRIEELRKENK